MSVCLHVCLCARGQTKALDPLGMDTWVLGTVDAESSLLLSLCRVMVPMAQTH